MKRFVSACPTRILICSRYRLLCEETTRLQQVGPIDLDADSDDLETDPVIRDSRLILDPGLLLVVSLLLVASTEIFRFLLFLGFGVVRPCWLCQKKKRRRWRWRLIQERTHKTAVDGNKESREEPNKTTSS
jgi:hypothetical protein